jgi:hypothetical protein
MSGMPTDPSVKFCLGSMSPWPTFRMFDGQHIPTMTAMASTDTTPYQCDLPIIQGNSP